MLHMMRVNVMNALGGANNRIWLQSGREKIRLKTILKKRYMNMSLYTETQ